MDEYGIAIWDLQFYKLDDEGNELKNPDGTVKLFQLKRDIDCSQVAEWFSYDELEEVA